MDNRKISVIRFRSTFATIFALMICAGYLLWKDHRLQKQNHTQAEQLKRRTDAQQAPRVGSTMSLLRGHTISQQNVTLDLSRRESGTLLLVLSPVCPYCRVNFHNWRDLLQGVSPDRVVWVDLTSTADARYMTTVGIPAKANFILLNADDTNQNRLIATPTTVLLDPHGVVRWSSSGIMSGEQVAQLRGLLTSSLM
jgi:hypothetical protein